MFSSIGIKIRAAFSRPNRAPNRPRALFSFGVIADVQYAEKDSRPSSSRPESIMHYRQGVSKLQTAVEEWTNRKEELSFLINLGDIIDGNNTPESTLSDLAVVVAPFNKLRQTLEVYHVIGNHCLRVPRNTLKDSLQIEKMHYSVKLWKGWRLLVLNTNEISTKAATPEEKQETAQFLAEQPLQSNSRIQTWNGGPGSKQVEWLKRELELAKQSGEKVIIGCHHPVGKDSARETHLAWNAPKIESIIVESQVVALVMSGHDHQGGYSKIGRTHFVTIQGVVEAPPQLDAFGIVHVADSQIKIEGYGVVPDRVLDLDN